MRLPRPSAARAWLAPALGLILTAAAPARARTPQAQVARFPWSNPALSPDRRAELVMQRMTLAEKIELVHGAGMPGFTATDPAIVRSDGGAGFVPGIARLGIPDLNMSDAAVGVAATARMGRYATALPSALALASSWDTALAYEYGSLIGAELAGEGFNVSLGGGVNLARDPRDGRTFEFLGEDPVLAGNMVARIIEGTQSRHVIGDVKHFAVNDEETGRTYLNAMIGERALRESDLLAFEIAVEQAHPGMVMCSYNLVNRVHACENPHLLHDILKKSWGFRGWVVSDWFATHSTVKAALAGLDMEMPDGRFFGARLEQAVQAGQVPMSRLDDMVRRVLRTEFALGVVDHAPVRAVPDVFGGLGFAQRVAEESAVLLKNAPGLLPLDPGKITSIAVIGSHADVGVLSGGGSAQVDPPGGNAVPVKIAANDPFARFRVPVWDPSSPLDAIRSHAPHARVTFDPGASAAAAAAAATAAQVAIVFVHQHMMEGVDLASLGLPDGQDRIVSAVAAANPRTIVVLETGGPVGMPWADRVGAILEAWYPGIRGGQAIANLLFGSVNPSGKLAITFPRSEADLPHPVLPVPPGPPPSPLAAMLSDVAPFDVEYSEGLAVGYKWLDSEHRQPLFPFGYGLSYSSYAYSDLKVTPRDGGLAIGFSVRNTGSRPGTEVAEAYLALPAGCGEPPKRLIGWARVSLAPGERKTVSLRIEPLYLAVFDTRGDRWRVFPGRYTLLVGSSSQDLPLQRAVMLP